MENILKIILIITLFLIMPRWLWGQETKTKIALLKYKEEEIGMPTQQPYPI